MGLVLPEIIAQDQAIEALALDIAHDRKRLTALEAPLEPQPLQKDRGEILRALLAANGGKALATEIRKKMHLSHAAFSLLLDTQRDYIEVKATSGNTEPFALPLRVYRVKVVFPESWADGSVLCPWAFHAGVELADVARAEQQINRTIRMGKR